KLARSGVGGGLAFASPSCGGFVTDQRTRANLHGERPPPFTLHFEKLIFGNTVEAAEFADRHCERVQVRAHRPPPVLRGISLLRYFQIAAAEAVGAGVPATPVKRAISARGIKNRREPSKRTE